MSYIAEDHAVWLGEQWQPISSFPFPSKWASAYHVLCCHSEKRWVRMGKWYAEQKQWYYSGTSERSQWAEQPGDAPTHWMPIPVIPT